MVESRYEVLTLNKESTVNTAYCFVSRIPRTLAVYIHFVTRLWGHIKGVYLFCNKELESMLAASPLMKI